MNEWWCRTGVVWYPDPNKIRDVKKKKQQQIVANKMHIIILILDDNTTKSHMGSVEQSFHKWITIVLWIHSEYSDIWEIYILYNCPEVMY